MSEVSLARQLFEKVTGKSVIETPTRPTRIVAKCIREERPPISFDPFDPKSVENARRAAARQDISGRVCGDNCTAPGPCLLRMLEDRDYEKFMGTFFSFYG